MKKTRIKGFTLVELLVVIAIIMLVIAVSVPAISVFMRGKSLEGAGQLVQTVFMLAKRATVTKKIRHRVLFFKKTINGDTLYGAKIYRCQSDFDPTNGVPGKTAGGYYKDFYFRKGLIPKLYYKEASNPGAITPNGDVPNAKNIRTDDDGGPPDHAGKLEVQPQGTILFGGQYQDQESFDVEHKLKNGDPISRTQKADIVIEQTASEKKCFVDIMPAVGRVYVRVLRATLSSGTSSP